MIATRFRSVGWVAGVATAALCCYLVSQSVAAERAAVARLDRRIADTQGEITRLTTEIGTRGRMSQIDRWNSENFGLQAPGARQFLASETQLAGFGHPQPAPPLDADVLATKGAVQQAAFQPKPTPAVPAVPVSPEAEPRPAAPEAQPMLRVASYVRAKAAAEAEAAPVVKVSFAPAARPLPRAAAATDKAKPKPLDLLPDDIDSLAAAEHARHAAHKSPK